MKSTYDQDDYIALTENKKFMIAVDAYRLGRCTLAQVLGMSLEPPFYTPDGLSPRAFATLAVRIAQDVEKGVLIIDPASQLECASFYEQQAIDQE